MYSKDILRNYIIFLKTNYTGSLPIYSRITEIPSDKSFIFVGTASSNEIYDKINNKHRLLNQSLYVEVNLYMDNDPYTPELKEIENLLGSINEIPAYNLSVKPPIKTNMEIIIEGTSGPLPTVDGDFEKTTYMVDIVNPSDS